MYICDLEIKNFRNFNTFSIKLKPKTLIIGDNNIGKTNLLSALSLLLNNEISQLRRRVLRLEDFNYDVIQNFKKDVANLAIEANKISFPTIEIIVTFTDFKNEDEEAIVCEWYSDDLYKKAQLKYRFYNSLTKKGEWVEKVRASFDAVDDEANLSDEELQNRLTKIQFPISEYKYRIEAGRGNVRPDNFQLAPLKLDFLDALRDARRELSASNENRLLFRILNNRDETQFSNIVDSANALNKSIKSDAGELAKIKGDISKLLEVLSLETDNTSNEIRFSFSELGVQELLRKIGLEYGDKPISVENNGLGRNNLLFMSLVLSHIQAKTDEPDFRVIAIEEPEAHISPVLQKHFAESVSDDDFFNKDTKRQVILTSHSTHISSHLDIENTVVMFRDGDEYKSHYLLDGIPDNANGKNTKQYLKKWLTATNSVMFFSRKIIFVEGIAEQILIPILFELHFGYKPEKMNCQIVNVNGLAFKHFLKVIKQGYFIKAAVLTDSDANTETAQRAIDLKKDYDDENILVSISEEDTFEKDLISSNRTGQGRTRLKNTIKDVRPNKYNAELEPLFNAKLDIDVIFEAIEGYKSEFAFRLHKELSQNGSGFSIPQYIIKVFNFIHGGK